MPIAPFLFGAVQKSTAPLTSKWHYEQFSFKFYFVSKRDRKEITMKKALVSVVILFVISLFTAIVSFAVCGGELIKTGIEYGIEQYREYKSTGENDITDIIENLR